jgi:hypothetical protein
MIGTIILTVFSILCAVWFLLSALTIFLMIKYNGLSITVWAIVILYCIITLPILISGITTVVQNDLDYSSLIPRIFLQ